MKHTKSRQETGSRAIAQAVVPLAVLFAIGLVAVLGARAAARQDLAPVARPSSEEASGELRRGALLTSPATETRRDPATASQGDEDASVEPNAAVAAEPIGLDSAFRPGLERIRSCAGAKDPHRLAWPHLEALAQRIREDVDHGVPGPIGLRLEEVLRSSTAESSFVRGAILVAFGLAYPRERSRSLAEEFLSEEPGELARSAWLCAGLSRGTAVDLRAFEPPHSKTWRSMWPVTVRGPVSDELLERAVRALAPPGRFSAGDPSLGAASAGWTEEGVLTREAIVLATLAPAAAAPGEVRDRLLDWSIGTDMSHACIWSLCVAARDDPELATRLRDLLGTLDLSSREGRLVAELLAVASRRADLVIDLLAGQLTDPDQATPETVRLIAQVNALAVLGEIAEREELELSTTALDLLTDVALDPAQPRDLRRLTLVQLSIAAPSRAPDLIELLLISPEGPDVKRMAAILTKFVPVERRQPMRDALMNTYVDDLPLDVRKSYITALKSLGGQDVRSFLQGLASSGSLPESLREELEEYLSS